MVTGHEALRIHPKCGDGSSLGPIDRAGSGGFKMPTSALCKGAVIVRSKGGLCSKNRRRISTWTAGKHREMAHKALQPRQRWRPQRLLISNVYMTSKSRWLARLTRDLCDAMQASGFSHTSYCLRAGYTWQRYAMKQSSWRLVEEERMLQHHALAVVRHVAERLASI